MKKLWFVISICFLFIFSSCEKDNDKFLGEDNGWTKEYPWLGSIVTQIENGDYKDVHGQPAVGLVSISVYGDDSKSLYFAISPAYSSYAFDEYVSSTIRLFNFPDNTRFYCYCTSVEGDDYT